MGGLGTGLHLTTSPPERTRDLAARAADSSTGVEASLSAALHRADGLGALQPLGQTTEDALLDVLVVTTPESISLHDLDGILHPQLLVDDPDRKSVV